VRVVIVQPSYIPWRGHFDLMRRADLFVFYDDVQYDKHGWRNRNRVKGPQGTQWLTIPAQTRGVVIQNTPICAVPTVGRDWAQKHLATLTHFYAAAPHFDEHRSWLQSLYADPPELLADFTIRTSMAIAERLGITHTRFLRSSTLGVEGRKSERLLAVLAKVGATHYLSGPSAKSYLDEAQFEAAGIAVEWMDYAGYPEYPQLHGPFDPQVSVLDLMFMTGADAPRYIWDRP
jgi:hypothetical protein